MRNSFATLTSSILLLQLLAACASPTVAPVEAPLAQPPAAQPLEAPPPGIGGAPEAAAEQPAESQPSGAIIYRTSSEVAPAAAVPHLIVKDAQLTLLVDDTDRVIDGIMQVVGDVGGYVISSRVTNQQWFDKTYKFATITMAVPADEFERALRRLRALALRINEETSSGQDVTDEYVDLQSRLESLEATRDRILDFLKRANTVDDALKVNEQLAAVEAQIEEVQGRINYLSGRASFSTITISLEPDLPVVTLTPTATASITPTPTATPTPLPWDPNKTFQRARGTLSGIYQAIGELVIWLAVVVVPVVGPLFLIGWLIWYFTRRRVGPPAAK
ncbi:MAG TPA: DUF4349 domain-containing protein [Anaerolineales bacterium]|nr:DUF4349 domain-containing protein [Anaerolineales bacterium]